MTLDSFMTPPFLVAGSHPNNCSNLISVPGLLSIAHYSHFQLFALPQLDLCSTQLRRNSHDQLLPGITLSLDFDHSTQHHCCYLRITTLSIGFTAGRLRRLMIGNSSSILQQFDDYCQSRFRWWAPLELPHARHQTGCTLGMELPLEWCPRWEPLGIRRMRRFHQLLGSLF